MSEKKKMPHILHLVIFLTILGVICAGILALVNNITAPIIEGNLQEELESSLNTIGVKEAKEVTDQYENNLVDGVEKIFEGKLEGTMCYVFQVSNKNSFTTITTLVVLAKDSGVILKVNPLSGTPSFSTHGKDDAILNHDFGVNGRNENDFETYFNAVSGATVSSGSIKASISIAYAQYNKIILE